MTFQELNSPEQLMQYLDKNFEYGVVDERGNKCYGNNSNKFQMVCNTQWKLHSVEEMLKVGVGHCYDQVEIEREWFDKHGFMVKTFWISAYQEEIKNSGFSHAYLLYLDKDVWKLFEHADSSNKGIHPFKNVDDAVKWQAEHQIKLAKSFTKPLKHYTVCIKEYNKPPKNLNMQEYLKFIDNSKDYMLQS